MIMRNVMIMFFALAALWSCEETEKGFLETAMGGYTTDSLVVYLESNPVDSVPYQGEKIQGINGTFPVDLSIEAVYDSSGVIVPVEVSAQIRLVLHGVFQIERDHTIPVGRYAADLRVTNINRSVVLPKVYRIIVLKEDD